MIFNVDSQLAEIDKLKKEVTENTNDINSQSSEINDLKKEVAENANDIELNKQTLGCVSKNVLNNTVNSMQINGLTFTTNENKSVKVNGICGGYTQYTIPFYPKFTGKVVMTGSPSDDCHIYAFDPVDNKRPYTDETKTTLQALNQGATNKEVIFYVEQGRQYSITIRVDKAGVQINNLTIYPMIRRLDKNGTPIGDDTYEPYHESVNNMLTNENNETFNFGVKDGVRGFFTNPSRADDSFIPFNQCNLKINMTFRLKVTGASSGTYIEPPARNLELYIMNGVPDKDVYSFFANTGSYAVPSTTVYFNDSLSITRIAMIDANKNEIKVLYST